MAKRFTDTNIWKTQKWFQRLTPIHKLFWRYLTDACDHAGVWKIDFLAITDDLGIDDFSIADFISSCNRDFDKLTGKPLQKERVVLVKDSYLWLTGFIQFQYENKHKKVNPKVAVIRSALEILEGLGTLQEGLHKGYISLTEPLDKGFITLKDKDREKEIQEEGGMGEGTADTEATGVCYEMLGAFKSANPSYQHDDTDLKDLLGIAYKIARMHGISKHDVVGDKKPFIVQEWWGLVAKIRGDPFYSAKDIAYLHKDWKSLTLKFYNRPPLQNGRIPNSQIV